MPAAPPLRHNPMLDRAAAAWAMGQPLPVASERNGYRGDFTAGMHISGPDSATLELLRRSGCRIVAGRGMRDIGEYRRGFDTWLVVGAFYRLPPGLQASTGTWMPAPRRDGGCRPQHRRRRRGHCRRRRARLRRCRATPARATAAGPLSTAALSPAQATRALQLVNDVRARGVHCGDELFGPAPPVTLSGTLAGVALGHASDMAEKNYFEHVDPAGHSPADRVRAVGYSEKLVGENIAYGPSRSTKWCRAGSIVQAIARTSWIRASSKWGSAWRGTCQAWVVLGAGVGRAAGLGAWLSNARLLRPAVTRSARSQAVRGSPRGACVTPVATAIVAQTTP